MSSNTTAAPLDPDDPAWALAAPTARELRTDAVLAAALVVGTLMSLALYTVAGISDKQAPMWVGVVWAFTINVPLAWRRRWPIAVVAVVSAAFIWGGVVMVPEYLFSNIALFLALYTVGAWLGNRRVAFIVRSVIIVGMFIWLIASMFMEATDPDSLPSFSRAGALSPLVAFMLAQILINLLYFGAAYYFGERAYLASRQRAVLEHRTIELEHERERNAKQAVALERVRIARELHDVVAHHVSVMGIQAAAARTVLDVDQKAAKDALANVELGARSAIDELHTMLNTLRAPEHEPADQIGPSTLGVDQLTRLADDSTASGLPARFELVGERTPVPAVVSLNLYRIAQEALTNARKYGGPQATAEVRLRYLGDAVELEVSNTGTVPAVARRGGLGLIGMRERVAASGGELEAGPRTRGGYLVRANIPLGQQRSVRDRRPVEHPAEQDEPVAASRRP